MGGEGGNDSILWLEKYRIISMLGENNGEVFLAEHVRLGTRRVIKRIRKNHPFYRQLAGEAEILGQLNHPGIVHLHDVEEDEEYLYLVEEFVEGASLKNLVLSDRLKESQIILIALQICSIIQYLHEQNPPIYYLDLKPEHLLISESHTIRLVDFGSALRAESKEILPEYRLCLATEGYAPPELYGKGEVGTYSDVYEIGRILHFLLTGSAVSEEMKSKDMARKIYTKKLWSLVQDCIQTEGKKRPTLEKLISSLERLTVRTKGRKKAINFSQGKRVIGLVGSHPGAGVTHIGIMLSYYLVGRTGNPVAFMEYNHHGDCARFLERKKAPEWHWHQKEPDFYPDLTAEELAQLINGDYRYYVIDFGCELQECLTEYLHCGEKVVVSQFTEWKLDDLKHMESQLAEIFRQEEWHWLYNLCVQKRNWEMIPPGLVFPWEGDIKHPSVQAKKIFEELLLTKQ